MTHDDSIDPQFRARLRSELVRGVRADTVRPSTTGRRTVLLVATGAMALAAGVFGVIGFQNMTSTPVAQPTADSVTVLCADGVSFPEDQSALKGVETVVDVGDGLDARMLAACTALWEDGTLTNRFVFQVGQPTPEPVPPLNLCTLPDGTPVAAPFTCEELDILFDGAVAP
ncbi:hypothetical protein [Microbacterium sp. A94]|uniref:hypothetical protein n=1 Tax=Microbacterium sp. A94 TaxID=3450717 RepID=UPI003F431324